MKNVLSEIHPELQAMAKMSPKFSFSRKNIWLVNLLIALMPAPKTPDISIENIFIPGQEESNEDPLTDLQAKIHCLANAGVDLAARGRVCDGETGDG